MRFASLLLVGALALVPRAARAQYTVAQDSTLRGLQRVWVAFVPNEGGLSAPVAEELRSYLALELRKAGLRVVREQSELADTDGIIRVTWVTIPRTLSTDVTLRIGVEQVAALGRTGQRLAMNTWFYEEVGRNVDPERVAKPMIMKGVDRLLSSWLDVNGR